MADVVRKADDDIAEVNEEGPPFTRPRGTSPTNHKYVPMNTMIMAPDVNTAWILAAMDSDLVAQHVTPKTYICGSSYRPRCGTLEKGDRGGIVLSA